MRHTIKLAAIVLVFVCLMTLTACTSKRNGMGGYEPNQRDTPSPTSEVQPFRTMTAAASMPILLMDGKTFVELEPLLQTLQLNYETDPESNKLLIGEYGVSYELAAGSTMVLKEDTELVLEEPPIHRDNQWLLPVSAISDLFAEEMTFRIVNGMLLIDPSPSDLTEPNEDAEPGSDQTGLEFGEDPDDPFKGDDPNAEEAPEGEDSPVWNALDEEAIDAAALKNININGMIKTARRYLGVKYKFGAKPYSQSSRFDCSTYTQYVFGKYGVKLPRTSRAQALRGNFVSRTKLRKGDLMFFYVPGRFKSNKVVGHVGIYIGNMQMIHSAPEPKNGVQITNINKAYWKKTYLRSKRIVS